ncbi:MAG: FecR domain-containing protein [Thermoanaerobaculales bacterium]
MTDQSNDFDPIFDHVTSEIQGQQLDDAVVQSASARVWSRLLIETGEHAPLTSCEEFQAEIPAYVARSLSPARSLLVDDHTRECLPCRRELIRIRTGKMELEQRQSPQASRPQARIFLRAAAAVLLVAGGWLATRTVGDVLADRSLRASVQTVDGTLQLVTREDSRTLMSGYGVVSRQTLRTARDSGAFLRLDDGSIVEMDERTELQLRASRRGTTIDLRRGNIIVHAADQNGGRLFVSTNACRVAVKGTIFAVDHGLKGSRVSVLEGEVEVRHGASKDLLNAGDQISTGDRLREVPLEEEFGWSKDAEMHRQLLREISILRRVVADAVDQAPPRTSTRLLDLAPDDTIVYVAMPNISENLDAARAAFEERLAVSEVLAEWWREEVVDPGIADQIEAFLNRLQPLGESIGAEAVITVPASVLDDLGEPLFLAELDDPTTFVSLLEAEVERANREGGGTAEIAIVTDPRTASATEADLLLWVEGNLFAAAGDLDTLVALASRVDDPTAAIFSATPLYRRLAEKYSDGVSWLFGVDVATVFAEALANQPDADTAVLRNLGFLDASTVVVERHRDGEWYATDADLLFDGPRHGIASWLAEPAPMGSLDFISPDAYVAVAAVTKDAAEMFDDLLAALSEGEYAPLTELRRMEAMLGIDLREDFAAALGGEAAIALDGPMLPRPSWKLIVEVYDSETLFHTLETVIARVNIRLAMDDKPAVVFESETMGAQTFYSISLEGEPVMAVLTSFDGYLVAAPSRALVQQAIDTRTSGATLPASAAFQAMLPANGYTNCSALVYRDLASLAAAIPAEMMDASGIAEILSDGLSKGLVCVFGEEDRITVSATGGSLVGLVSALGMQGATIAGHGEIEAIEKIDALSSQG